METEGSSGEGGEPCPTEPYGDRSVVAVDQAWGEVDSLSTRELLGMIDDRTILYLYDYMQKFINVQVKRVKVYSTQIML